MVSVQKTLELFLELSLSYGSPPELKVMPLWRRERRVMQFVDRQGPRFFGDGRNVASFAAYNSQKGLDLKAGLRDFVKSVKRQCVVCQLYTCPIERMH